jgi:hypothetical protein
VASFRGAGLCLLSLLGSQLLLIYLLQGELAQLLVSKPDYLYLQVLPGLAWPLVAAWLWAAWEARRHPGSTALPLGYSLTTALLLVSTVLAPIFRYGLGQGLAVEQASNLAWSAGVALTLVTGVLQLLLAGLEPLWGRALPQRLCLALSAWLALQAGTAYLPWLSDHPLMAMSGWLPLVAFAVVGLPRPFGLSLGWLCLSFGVLTQIFSGERFLLPDLEGSLLPNWERRFLWEGWQSLTVVPEFFSAAIPLLALGLAKDGLLLGEAKSLEKPLCSRRSLAGLGLCNLLGASLGCGIPLGILPGLSGFARLGGGQFYAQGAGLLLLAFSLLGGFGTLFSLLPLPTLGALLLVCLVFSAGISLQRETFLGGPLAAAWAGAQVNLLVGWVWGGMAEGLAQRHLGQAAGMAIVGSLLAATGLLHRGIWNPDFDPLAGGYLLLALVLHLGWLLPTVAPPGPPPEPPQPSDSSESLSTSAFGIPAGNPSVEGAASGPLN